MKARMTIALIAAPQRTVTEPRMNAIFMGTHSVLNQARMRVGAAVVKHLFYKAVKKCNSADSTTA